MDSPAAAAPHGQQQQPSKPISIKLPTIPSFNDLNTLVREDTEPLTFDRSWSGSSVEFHADTPHRPSSFANTFSSALYELMRGN